MVDNARLAEAPLAIGAVVAVKMALDPLDLVRLPHIAVGAVDGLQQVLVGQDALAAEAAHKVALQQAHLLQHCPHMGVGRGYGEARDAHFDRGGVGAVDAEERVGNRLLDIQRHEGRGGHAVLRNQLRAGGHREVLALPGELHGVVDEEEGQVLGVVGVEPACRQHAHIEMALYDVLVLALVVSVVEDELCNVREDVDAFGNDRLISKVIRVAGKNESNTYPPPFEVGNVFDCAIGCKRKKCRSLRPGLAPHDVSSLRGEGGPPVLGF
mmetsp:Transcript_85444/g.227824  ORF Transcript_85444/g.227824 Transcript_85444/m.227824 type:complete len:268 (-) Transcript_85444:304-1107(-)